MAERVKAEVLDSTPLAGAKVVPVTEEKLIPDDTPEPGAELEDADDDSGPAYKREEIGARLKGDHALANAEATEETPVELMKKLDGEDMVPLLFPRKVMLQDAGIMHTWEAGVHLVPASLSNHWYLKHHRVRKAGAVVKKEHAA